jgi:hypothetical protein
LHKESLKDGKSHSGIIIAKRRPLMELTARGGPTAHSLAR